MKDDIVKNTLKEKITPSLLKISDHKSTANIITEIETYTNTEHESLPFLDFYGSRSIKEENDFELALCKAKKYDEYGYVGDLFED